MRKPEWLQRRQPSSSSLSPVKSLLRRHRLNTVCEEARCPNIAECFCKGTATFMILGEICTRGCRFCSVKTGKPLMSSAEFASEAFAIASAVKELNLRHVVITSVARDDLHDGGASGFVECVTAIRGEISNVTIELLVPDFRGREESVKAVLEVRPDVLNHNIETVPRLYRRVRPGATYERSLGLLRFAKEYAPEVTTKTGIMVGLGETREEVMKVLDDAVSSGIDMFTIGQYLQPTRAHLPVEEFVPPAAFEDYESYGRKIGIREVFSAPFVRSSYHAGELLRGAKSHVDALEVGA